ncbi:hypothetical protein F5J12DRAFT_896429 [Pisolithus orientalis]|uniref:uncharacterized protein n=1 Tax=Pisolithus orientalis TaxID=936130 RepID=UPI002224BA47|nr:uncharacterized protein F5J12DRAFT_896429 [Pisolithus orientalis]KAI5995796.1 hypothetical protein F5J12DRAFT_896429 [Pisolithus orientalis]
MSIHIYDYLRLFGPVQSWWCFPYECLIGHLQHMPTNHKFGQQEETVYKHSYEVPNSNLGSLAQMLQQSFSNVNLFSTNTYLTPKA